jgi:hypothetical protein
LDITQLILDDHHEQRRLFSILEQIGSADTASLASVWDRLAIFLELHAKAEEEFFYPELLKAGAGAGGKPTPEAETEDAIKDHNEIRDAVAAVGRHAPGTDAWLAAIARANEANSDHMGEEERQGLTDFRRNVDLETRHRLGILFVAFESRHRGGIVAEDIGPEAYVREHSA